MTEQTMEDRARLVARYWPYVYRVPARFILADWDDPTPVQRCPTCGQFEDPSAELAQVTAELDDAHRDVNRLTARIQSDTYIQETAAYWQRRAERLDAALRSTMNTAGSARNTDPYPPEPPVGTVLQVHGNVDWDRRTDGWHCANPGESSCRNCPCGWDEVWDRVGTNVDSTIVLPGAGER